MSLVKVMNSRTLDRKELVTAMTKATSQHILVNGDATLNSELKQRAIHSETLHVQPSISIHGYLANKGVHTVSNPLRTLHSQTIHLFRGHPTTNNKNILRE